jgi:hypothetical protein
MLAPPLPAGKFAGVSLPPLLAGPDSADARAARTGEAGSDQGAQPSNTAPYNSKEQEKGCSIRLLRLAVDSLYLSYPGDLSATAVATLKKLKEYAQSEHLEYQAKAQYPLGNHVFEVKDRGAGRFPYVLADNAYRIQLSNPGKKLPMAYVQVSAEYLAHRGPVEVANELEGLLLEFCNADSGWFGRNSVSRIDLAADFVSPVSMESWDRNAWVTHATEIHSYAVDREFTGWTVGLGGSIGCRLYDKVREIVHSGKCWVLNQWLPAGWQAGETVWRLEFEFKRDFLKGRGLGPLETILENLDGLWSYATTEWLRLSIPNPADSTRSRWPIHPLWALLASVDWQTAKNIPLERFSNARTPNDLRHITVLLGALSSYMASHGLDDRNQAVDELLGHMHEHYGVIASRKGLTFDEFLARRVALKAREFNTAINEPGKVDNLKDDFRREQEDSPYRRASQGE